MRARLYRFACFTSFPSAFVVNVLAAILGIFVSVAPVHPARASSDTDCDASLRLKYPDFSRCDSTTALGPGNDTRVNLMLLLLDRDAPPPAFLPAKSSPLQPLRADATPLFTWMEIRDRYFDPPKGEGRFAVGEGSRCRSNAAGLAAFEKAVNAASDVTASERVVLIEARKGLTPTCKDTGKEADEGPASPQASVPSVQSPAGRAFATYLEGTDAFYQGRYKTALDRFSRLHGTANTWLADTADYMRARAELNRLQVGAFDEYGTFAGSNKIDQKAAAEAATRLETYLHDHSNGAYVASARGLLRRIYWLSGRTDALAATYAALIAMPAAERGIDDAALSEEIASKLLPVMKPEMTRDPILLAAFDLMAMRAPKSGATASQAAPPDTRHIDLETQRGAFTTAPGLFDFLVAAQAFYVDQDPVKVMKLLTDDTHRRGGDHLWFSRQILRGLALEAKGDRNARGFWKELFPNAPRPLDGLAVQLALAMHDERAGTLGDVFAKGSVVTSPKFRETLLEYSADAALLRRQATDAGVPETERRIALGTLLWKELTRGRTADFIADVALVPSGTSADGASRSVGAFIAPAPGDIDCPPLRETAAQLADDPLAVRPRLCLAEFVRVNGMDQNPYDAPVPADDLGGGPSRFPGKPYARADTYKAVIADKTASASDKAFALYRAVKCYEPSNINECGGKDVPKAQRKAWYVALKRKYRASRWAKELSHWW